ncbi:hypothetical protein ANO11243_065090 [Dothideomycetidae sp. 11243]|nr:hypothetical protein ANO11243_065090 [fungal sp. No.11243]
MSSDKEQSFPVLFTVGNSSRHEVMLIDPSASMKDLSTRVESITAASPNCVEALAKYSKKKTTLQVKGFKVRWSGEPREARLWPSSTQLTDENVEAVLRLMALHQGKDIIEVEFEQSTEEESTEEEKSAEKS